MKRNMSEVHAMRGSGGVLLKMVVAVTAVLAAPAAIAYVGPGAGLSLVGALWGLIVAIFAALGFILMWPIRRMMRRRRNAAESAQQTQARDETAHHANEQSRNSSDDAR